MPPGTLHSLDPCCAARERLYEGKSPGAGFPPAEVIERPRARCAARTREQSAR